MNISRSGTGLCLSGGGFRAAIFHLGSLRRLNELAVLSRLRSVSSASGGSITLGVLATRWSQLKPDIDGRFQGFDETLASPLRRFCSKNLINRMLFRRWINPKALWLALAGRWSLTRVMADELENQLQLGVNLGDLPDSPVFTFCACNLITGVNWIFRAGQMGDYRVGYMDSGDVSVGRAAAASAAFPVGFPPLAVKVADPDSFAGGDAECPAEAKNKVLLTDGGVYDNMATEPIWKNHEYVFVSDAGQPLGLNPGQGTSLLKSLERCVYVMLNQGQALRRRTLMKEFTDGLVKGAYWGIATDYTDYGSMPPVPYVRDAHRILNGVRIDFDNLTEGEMCCLENHGYLLTECAIRRYVPSVPGLKDAGFRWPHPEWAEEAKMRAALAESFKRHWWS